MQSVHADLDKRMDGLVDWMQASTVRDLVMLKARGSAGKYVVADESKTRLITRGRQDQKMAELLLNRAG